MEITEVFEETRIRRFYKGLEYYPLYRRMYFDESFFDVTLEDVNGLLKFMNRFNMPFTAMMVIREKYRQILTNDTHRVQIIINLYGLHYPEHNVENINSNGTFRINGYTPLQWEYLTSESIIGFPQNGVTRFINECEKKGNEQALEIIKTKFGCALEERERNHNVKILLEHGLPPDTKFSQLDNRYIDGMTFNCWRLLHDDEYAPSKAILVSNHHFLKQRYRREEVAFIEDKYHDILFPSREEIISDLEKEEANEYFAHIHDWPY